MRKAFFILLIIVSACKDETKVVEIPKEIPEEAPLEIAIEKTGTQVKPTAKQILETLKTQGFETFDYVDKKTKDTIIMQKYFMAFLKKGPIVNQNEEEVVILQEEHLSHLEKMYALGYADISEPFIDDGDIRGVTIYNVPTLAMADSLAKSDPIVKAGRLEVEIHPWWAAKGYHLR
ncbi:YciI family protein [Lacinutrix sp. Hel_I_90]|uniref:YciI family protein n=1 Tax=Lacinutrix sp. Hel_I_90 TaxID=1249999 RepID=UPI0005C81DD3|nr:phenylalanyl-tRNA synthetase subunit alpha [Lacinutrix sp. Hel_I_90]